MPTEQRGRYSTRYGTHTTRTTHTHTYTYPTTTTSRSSSSEDYIARPTYSSTDYISARISSSPSRSMHNDKDDADEDYIARPYESRADWISPRSRERTPSTAARPRKKKVGSSGLARKSKLGRERRDSGVAASSPSTRPPLSSTNSSVSASSFSAPIESRSEKVGRRRRGTAYSDSPSSVGSACEPKPKQQQRKRESRAYGFVADQAWEEERREVVSSQGFASSKFTTSVGEKLHETYAQPKKLIKTRGRGLPGAFVAEHETPSPPAHPTAWRTHDDDKAGASDVSTFRSGSASGLGTPLLSPSFSAPYSTTSSKRRGSDYDDVYDSSSDRSDIVQRRRSHLSFSSSSSSSEDNRASDEDDISNGSDYVFDGEDRSDAESIGERSDVAGISDAESDEEPEVRERERGYREAYVEDGYEGYSDEDD